MNEIIIYESETNQIEVTVQFEKDTVWLNLSQIAVLFERDRTVIGRHIRNIFNEKELDEEVVCANFAHTTQHGAIKGKVQSKDVKHFNLDVIISVGYRVKSLQATQFRIWANRILKDFLVKGYAINEKRLAQKEQEVQILKNGIQILSRVIEDKTADNEWLSVFAKGLTLLDDYDHVQLDVTGLTIKEATYPDLEDYQVLIHDMVAKFDSAVYFSESDTFNSFQ